MTFQSEGTFHHVPGDHAEFDLPRNQPNTSLNSPSKEYLELLKSTLLRVYPVADVPSFEDLLRAVDHADKEVGKDTIAMTDHKDVHSEQIAVQAGDGNVTLTGPGGVIVLSPEAAEETSDQLWMSAMAARRGQQRTYP